MTAASSPRRATAAALAATVLAGFALRAWRLSFPGLTSDEAFSWRLAAYPWPEMLRRAAEDVHPPLFSIVLSGWLHLWGHGPLALRGLSVTLGTAVILLAFALVREAARLDGPDGAAHARRGALPAALLVALHATPVLQSRNARMYALGTAAAVASAWLLLRARRAPSVGWWAAWGLVATLAVASHYYVVFTIAAQVLWLVATRRRSEHFPWRGLLIAATVALGLATPWLPTLWEHARAVRAEYWDEPSPPTWIGHGLARWALGLDAPAAPLVALLLVVCLAGAAGRGRAGRFLAAQAAAPWAFALLVSVSAGRPVLDRYMVFAHVFLLCALAVGAAGLESRALRGAAVAGLLAVTSWGLLDVLRRYPSEPSAIFAATRFLKRQAGPDEVVVVESPRVLNKVRYYARQLDAEWLQVRAVYPERRPVSRHASHVVSLAPGEEIAALRVFSSGASTVWTGRESTAPPAAAPPGWEITFARILEGGEDTRFALVRYQRAASGP